MAYRLSALARKFRDDEAAVRAQLAEPVLVWEVRRAPEPSDGDTTAVTAVLEEELDGHQAEPSTEEDSLVFVLDRSAKTVGRIRQNDVVLPDRSVSRVHAYIQREPGGRGWRVVDKGSSNGSWLGDERLVPNQAELLKDKARLRFGDVAVRFFTPDSFFEYLRHVKPAADGSPYEVLEESLTPFPKSGLAEGAPRESFEVTLSLGELDALLDFYRQGARLFDLVEKTPVGEMAVSKARERAELANRVLRRLVVASRPTGG